MRAQSSPEFDIPAVRTEVNRNRKWHLHRNADLFILLSFVVVDIPWKGVWTFLFIHAGAAFWALLWFNQFHFHLRPRDHSTTPVYILGLTRRRSALSWWQDETRTSAARARQGDAMKSQAETLADLNTRCDGPNQFENFDRAFRASLTIPKAALLKEDQAGAGKEAVEEGKLGGKVIPKRR
jgi:hypothetical protein